jgi:hypothetical protein
MEPPTVKWFKHDTDAHVDAKLDKVLMHYGSHGYAVYFYCLELIAGKIDAQNTSCALEHDAEQIGSRLKIDSREVTGILTYMVDIGLFEKEIEGAITCLKLLGRLDKSMTNSPQLRKLIGEERQKTSGNVMTRHDMSGHVTPDKKRREEKRKEKNLLTDVSVIAFDDWYQHYGRKNARGAAEKAWKKLNPEEKRLALKRVQSPAFQSWMKSQVTEDKDCRPYPATWLNARQWTDELTQDAKVMSTTWEGPPPCRR